tara:strand:+ start:2969 stop:3160 length:192 start_codon:yes stop_codon:yes gene_type:complete
MKITKLKRGWRINLSDTEMDILRIQVQEGFSQMTEDIKYDCAPLSPAAKRIMTEVFDMKREWI